MQSNEDPFGDKDAPQYENQYTLWLTGFVVFGSIGYALVNQDSISGLCFCLCFIVIPFVCCLLNATTNVRKNP